MKKTFRTNFEILELLGGTEPAKDRAPGLFRDHSAAAQLLRPSSQDPIDMRDLREAFGRISPGVDLTRLADGEVIERLAARTAIGDLSLVARRSDSIGSGKG